ncbi:hypothetical protein BC834DRAFT_1044416 [Gloeopeniophorella convolvens]|nr:hypothetical protein BC834DRAFT_1044416 [Gloeopeniophorella convolvens]
MSSNSHRGLEPVPTSDEDESWDVIEIVAEDAKRYKVRWAGNNPKTGKPWPLDWVPRSHCSAELIQKWQSTKAQRQSSLAVASKPAVPETHRPTVDSYKRPAARNKPAVPTSSSNRLTRKRKHPTPSGSSSDTGSRSARPRRNRQSPVSDEGELGGSNRTREISPPRSRSQSRKGRADSVENLSIHPPLEEVEMWVPTPGAKFGPPKRRRIGPASQHRPGGTSIGTLPPGGASVCLPSQSSASRPSNLPPSEIIALRQEEQESSQSQQVSLASAVEKPREPSVGFLSSGPSKRPQAGTEKAKEGPRTTFETNTNVQLSHQDTAMKGGDGFSGDSDRTQAETRQTSFVAGRSSGSAEDATRRPTSPRTSRISQHTPAVISGSVADEPPALFPPRDGKLSEGASSASKPVASRPSSSASLHTGPPSNDNPLTSLGDNQSRRSGGSLAERRAVEARRRLQELRRAAVRLKGGPAEGQSSVLDKPQTTEQPPPHVALQQVMDSLRSPGQSQIDLSQDSTSSPSQDVEHHAEDMSIALGEHVAACEKVVNAGPDRFPLKGDSAPAESGPEHLNTSTRDEIPPTASDGTQSRSHAASSQVSLGTQLAAALSLLHKKSEEASELQAHVDALNARAADAEAKLGNMQNLIQAPHAVENSVYASAEAQTDQEDATLAAARAAWAQETTALQEEADRLRADKARALADVDLFRDQYQRASAFVSTTRSENAELLSRAALAESQATQGVALMRATFEARVSKLEAELQKYKALSELLTERARRTDDDVRYRAAMAPELERDFRGLRSQFREVEAELDEARDELRTERKRNARLRVLLAESRSNEMKISSSQKAEPHHPWSDDEEEDGDYLPGPTDSPSPGQGSDGLTDQRSTGTKPDYGDATEPPADDAEQMASTGLGNDFGGSRSDLVYLCRWRSNDPAQKCTAAVGSKDELNTHVLSEHLSCH